MGNGVLITATPVAWNICGEVYTLFKRIVSQYCTGSQILKVPVPDFAGSNINTTQFMAINFCSTFAQIRSKDNPVP